MGYLSISQFFTQRVSICKNMFNCQDICLCVMRFYELNDTIMSVSFRIRMNAISLILLVDKNGKVGYRIMLDFEIHGHAKSA